MTDKLLISFESNKDVAEMLENLENHEYSFNFEVRRLNMEEIKIKLDRTPVPRLRKFVKGVFNAAA